MMRVLLLTSTLVVSGCISLLPEPPPPPRVFALEAGAVERLTGAPVDAVISVSGPAGERTILGADMIWRNGDELAYVSQTQWSNRASDALQAVLVETLTRQGRFRAAVRAGDARSDYEIRWDVLDFEVQENGMTARFVADVKLVSAPGRRIIASEIITAEAPVSDRSATIAAQALARAAREGSARIGVFAADAASVDQANAASISR
ncbi:hypothetical protein U91I_04010 [alpha proteobacterium U9-1i]|nr:hypothetical protein U91I_04010 [alpha proteobacterium U9-1i]